MLNGIPTWSAPGKVCCEAASIFTNISMTVWAERNQFEIRQGDFPEEVEQTVCLHTACKYWLTGMFEVEEKHQNRFKSMLKCVVVSNLQFS